MGFNSDKDEGEKYESHILLKLNEMYGIQCELNPNIRWIDIVHELMDIEVKYDRQMKDTGNIFLEYSGANGRKSWVMQYDDGLFIYWDYERALVFSLPTLQEFVLQSIIDKSFRHINAGDGWRSKGILLPYEEAKKIARKEIIF